MKRTFITSCLLLIATFSFSQEYQEINNNPDFNGFSLIESYPQYPGGSEGLLNDIANNIVVPQKAKKKDIHGSVTVSFVVQIDGTVSEITIVESDNKVFNQPTIHAIEKLKKWKPAIQKGEPVKAAYQQKINF